MQEREIETDKSIWSYEMINTKIESLRRQFRSWTGKSTSALMIDMICDLIPSDLKSGWTNQSSIKSTNQKAGVYPPTSIKILLDLLLSRIVQPELSCTILFYLMLDLIEMTSSSGNRDVITVDEHFLETFGSALRINQGLIDYAIGCWNLDNGRGEEAVRVFLSSGCITPITISHWKNVIYQLLSFGLSSDALRFLKVPIPEPCNKAEYLEILNAKIDIYLANKKCRQCWLLIRSVPDRKIRIEKFGFFIRESIHLNLESKIIGLPLNSEENEIVIREMKINQKPDLFQICKLYHTKSSKSSALDEPIKTLDFQSKSSGTQDNCFVLNEMNEKLIEEAKNLFESPSLEQMKSLREESRRNIPDLPPSSPSRGLLKTSSSQNSELSSLSEANSQSTTSTVKSNKRVLRFQKDVEDREEEPEEPEEAVTMIEDDINTENDEEVTEDDEEMEVDQPEIVQAEAVQENNEEDHEDFEEVSHSQTLYGDSQESTNQKSEAEGQSQGEIVISSQESIDVRPMRNLSMEGITVIESSSDELEDEKKDNEESIKEPSENQMATQLNEDKLYNESIYLSPETSITETKTEVTVEEFEEVRPEEVKENLEERVSEEVLSEEAEEKISEDFERISEEIEDENLKALKENDDLTEGDLQVLAEGDQATDMESEAPSIPVGFEIRKGSPSSLKIIQKDISKEMGTDVAEAVGLEFNCVDSDRSDNEVIIEEKPHIPEVTYDGDKEDEEDLEDHDEDKDDSAKGSF